MPWCPKCRNEYVEGITRCADCGSELVDSLKEVERETLICADAEKIQEMRRFFLANGLKDVQLEPEEDGTVAISVPAEEKQRAERFMSVFLKQWKLEKGEETPEEASDPEENPVSNMEEDSSLQDAGTAGTEKIVGSQSGRIYEEASQKAENFRSGAYTLLAIGTIGLILLICLLAGVLPFRLTGPSRYLTGGVMSALFIAFLGLGWSSLKSFHKFEGKAKEESVLKEELRRWCRENLTAERVDASIEELPASEEERYFKRTERIRSMIADNFLNLEPGYLENFVDEIYPEYFD